MELSNEVFEYAHKEVSGEYVGKPVDIALMEEHRDFKKKIEELEANLVKIEILNTLKDSGLFKDVHFGEAYQVHLSAMKDKEKLIGIAEKHSLGVLFYALYSLGFKAGIKAR